MVEETIIAKTNYSVIHEVIVGDTRYRRVVVGDESYVIMFTTSMSRRVGEFSQTGDGGAFIRGNYDVLSLGYDLFAGMHD